MRHWLIDGNNVFGSRPDGWWNDRAGAAGRLAERVADWCRGHDDEVVLVFDRPVSADTLGLSGGNLRIEQARRKGRDAADDRLVELAAELVAELPDGDGDSERAGPVVVVSSDRGLLDRLPGPVERWGAGRFRRLIEY